MIQKRDLVDEITEMIGAAESNQDSSQILSALKKLNDDFKSSPYNHDPATYIQNKALGITSGHVIGCGSIAQGREVYHCLTLNLNKRDPAKGLLQRMEAVFKTDEQVYVISEDKSVIGIAITTETAADAKTLPA